MVSKVFHRLKKKIMVLAAIDALKKLGESDEEILDFIAKNYHVPPDFVRELMKVWPNPLLDDGEEHDNDTAPSVPATA